MANRRPNSCPDTWKHAMSEISDNRPSTSLGVQSNDGMADSAEDAGEYNELNRAKVNPWIRPVSVAQDNETLLSDVSNRGNPVSLRDRVSSVMSSETLGTNNFSSSGGRMTNESINDDVTTLALEDACAGSGAETEKTEEDWVLVNKSASNTVMPCDSEDETNVLVSCPKVESEEVERTKLLLTDMYDSTSKGLPDAPSTSNTGEDSTIGSNSEATTEVTQKKARKRKGLLIGNVVTFANSVSKWKHCGNTSHQRKIGFATLDFEHRQLLAAEADNMKIEIPDAMLRTIKEEAYKIVLKTTQAYRSQVGSKHKLTTEAVHYLKDLREELFNINNT